MNVEDTVRLTAATTAQVPYAVHVHHGGGPPVIVAGLTRSGALQVAAELTTPRTGEVDPFVAVEITRPTATDTPTRDYALVRRTQITAVEVTTG